MFCSKCGYNVPKGKKRCPNCGQEAEYSQSCGGFYDIVKEGPGANGYRGAGMGEMSSMSQQDAPKAGKLPIILCVISMLIAIGSLGGVFVMKQQVDKLEAKIEKKADKQETSDPESTEVETPGPESTEVETPGPESTEVETPGPESTEVETPGPESTEVEIPAPESKQEEGNEQGDSEDDYMQEIAINEGQNDEKNEPPVHSTESN